MAFWTCTKRFFFCNTQNGFHQQNLGLCQQQNQWFHQWINWPDQLIPTGRDFMVPILPPYFDHVNVEHDMTETVGFWGSPFSNQPIYHVFRTIRSFLAPHVVFTKNMDIWQYMGMGQN